MMYITYTDLKSFIKKINGCAEKPRKTHRKIFNMDEYVTCGFSVSTIDDKENKNSLYRGENYTKKFLSYLREYTTNCQTTIIILS